MTVRSFDLPTISAGDVHCYTVHPTGGVYLDADETGVCRYVPVRATELAEHLAAVDVWTPAAFAGGARDVRITYGYPPTVELRGPRDTWHELSALDSATVLRYVVRVLLAARSL